MGHPKFFWQHFLKQKTALLIIFLIFNSKSDAQFMIGGNEQSLSPNPLSSTFDIGANTATAALYNQLPLYPAPTTGDVQSSNAFAFSTTASNISKVYWKTLMADNSNYQGSFDISSDKYVAYVDLALVSNVTTTVMYVVTQEVLNNVQYTYLRSYFWNGTTYAFQNKEVLYPPGNGGGDYTISIDNNYLGNFILCWQRNVAAAGSPNSLNVFALPGKFSSSFPYYTLGTNVLNITQLSGTNPAGVFDSHVYPDVSINNHNKVAFVYEEYPSTVKVFSTEGDMDYNTFQFSNILTRQVAVYPAFSLAYRPKIAYWKYDPSNVPFYNGDDYAIAYSIHQGATTTSNYDLVSICSYNGNFTSPRILNSLGSLNTIHSQFWDHEILPTYYFTNTPGVIAETYEIVTEFKDVNAYIYGTTSNKIISRTTMLDNSPSPDEHLGAGNGYGSANYFVLTSANMANNDIRNTSAGVTKNDPYTIYFTSVKTGYPIGGPPAEVITGFMYGPCALYCRSLNLKDSTQNLVNNNFAKSQSISDDKNLLNNTSNELFYPNPAGNFVNLNLTNSKFSLSKKVNSISVLNMEGKCVKKMQLQPGQSYINLSGVNRGMYVIQISNNSNSYSQKLIITKSN